MTGHFGCPNARTRRWARGPCNPRPGEVEAELGGRDAEDGIRVAEVQVWTVLERTDWLREVREPAGNDGPWRLR